MYRNSISVSACTIYATEPTYSWNLNGAYRTLTTVIGQDDGSESHRAVVRVAISGDGRLLASRRTTYGASSSVSVDVSGVRQLRISFTELSCGEDGGAAVVLGAPRVTG